MLVPLPMKAFLFSLLVALICVTKSKAEDHEDPFTLTVVPSRSGQGQGIEMSDDGPRTFYVVLGNRSKEARKVFEDWNSWGYQNISFEVTLPDGKKVLLSRRDQDFTRNAPTTFLIPAGESQVFEIHLDKWWESKPALELKARVENKISLKAIYEVKKGPEAIADGVWTGRVESKGYDFNLWFREKK